MGKSRIRLLFAITLSVLLAACTSGLPGAPPSATQTPSRGVNVPAPDTSDGTQEQAGMADGSVAIQQAQQVHTIDTGPLLVHAPQAWRPHLVVTKCSGEVDVCSDGQAYEIAETVGNLLTTAGAAQLWNGLSTSGLATPWSTTNVQFAVGDSTTAATAAQTDLQAAAGTKINAADLTSCTNATPVVCSGTLSPAAVAGQVYQFAGFSGAGSGTLNNTWEATATSNASTITLLNTASPGAITVTGGTVKPINYYRQQANGSGSAVVSSNQIVYVATIGTANGNFAWQEWSMTTGAAATNKQAQPPPVILNRAVVSLGTKTSASSWTATLTLSLS